MRIAFLLASSVLAIVAACADDAAPPSVFGNAPPAPVPTTRQPPPGTITDEDAGPEQCTGLVQAGVEIAEIGYPSAPPQAVGGPIGDGTYVLVRAERYRFDAGVTDPDTEEPAPNIGPTGAMVRGTLVVVGTRLRLLAARGTSPLPADTATAWDGTVDGTTVELREICPTKGRTVKRSFSVVGGNFAFLDGDTRESYKRQDP